MQTVGSGDGRVNIDTSNFQLLLKEIQKFESKMIVPVERGLLAASIVVQNEARKRAPVDAGILRNKILATGKIDRSGRSIVTSVIAHTKYALFIEVGTGIFGPKKKRIYPKHAKVLRFMTSRTQGNYAPELASGRGVVFAKSVKGMPARPFLAPAGFKTGTAQLGAYKKAFSDWLKGMKGK